MYVCMLYTDGSISVTTEDVCVCVRVRVCMLCTDGSISVTTTGEVCVCVYVYVCMYVIYRWQ